MTSDIQSGRPPGSRNGHLVRNTAFNLAGQLLPLLVGIVTMPYIVRQLGPERFGVLGIVWVVFGYFSMFDLGLGRATTKFLSEALSRNDYQYVPTLVWTSLGVQLIFGMVGALLLAGTAPILADRLLKIPAGFVGETRTTLLALAFALPAVLLGNGLRSVLEGCQRFDITNLLRVPASTLVFLIPALALPFGFRLPGIVVLLLVSRVAFALAHLWYCYRVLPCLRGPVHLGPGVIKSLLTYGGWVTVANITNPLLLYMDRFIIGISLSVALVGYYTAPFEAVTKLWLIPASLATTLLPASSALGSARRTELSSIYSRSIKCLFLGLSPIILTLAVFAHPIMQLWLGPAFAAKSALVLQILTIGVFVNCFAHIPYSLLQGLGRPDAPAKLFLLELPTYGLLCWFMITHAGLPGAAVAWSLRVAVEVALLMLLLWKIYGLSPAAVFANRMARALVLFVCTATFLYMCRICFASSLPAVVAGTILVLIVFAVSAWRLVLDEDERATIWSLLAPISIALRARESGGANAQ